MSHAARRRLAARSIGWGIGLAAAGPLLMACSDAEEVRGTRDDGSAVARSSSPPAARLVTAQGPGYGGFKARLTGTVGLTPGGCLSLDGRLLVAPEGATLRGESVEIPGYAPFRIGDDVELAGGEAEVGADPLPGAEGCAPEVPEVVLVAAR